MGDDITRDLEAELGELARLRLVVEEDRRDLAAAAHGHGVPSVASGRRVARRSRAVIARAEASLARIEALMRKGK